MRSLILIAILFLTSCSSELQYEKKVAENFEFSAPNSLVDIGINDPYASMELGDVNSEWYLKVLLQPNELGITQNELKTMSSGDIEMYLSLEKELYATYMTTHEIIDSKTEDINGRLGATVNLKTEAGDQPIHYQIAYVFTPHIIHQLHMWCPSNRYNGLSEHFSTIKQSYEPK